ncbi:MAG TPA: type VI secretion system contractile sheath large subunit [Candidatus Sulfotelmatobacter sp.]|jgi:type VI secretion system protein ImpC
MPKPFDFGAINLTTGEDSSRAHPTPETPFCVAILGDFSGRANRRIVNVETIGERRAVLVDRDNFDEVLSRAGVEIRLAMGNDSLQLRFSELDDFHPDRVFQNLEIFGKLRDLRGRLQDSARFREAADELELGSSAAVRESERLEALPAAAPVASRLASGSLLDEMIEQSEARAITSSYERSNERSGKRRDDVGEFARRIVAQHLVNSPDPRQPEVLAVIDNAIGGLMSAILHHPDWQALEAIWRATFLLVRQLETGSNLKLYLFDITKQELAADLGSGNDLRNTGTYRLLVEKSVGTQGAEPWAILVGNYRFGPSEDDTRLLFRMAEVAQGAGAPFLAEAEAQLLGCSSLESTPHPREWALPGKLARWSELRRQTEASAVGLALPRFLLRLPYGKKTSALESFDFEEMTDKRVHEDYLWGNPAFATALLLAESFSEAGWEMHPGSVAQIDNLPIHVYSRNGQLESQPCAEVALPEDAVERMIEDGLIPLISFKDRDLVRVARFQSVADPARGLAGRWVK